MSTNIENPLDIKELEKLANQFFKAAPGEAPVNLVASPTPYTDYHPSIDQLDTIPGANGLPINLSGNNTQSTPASGVGASPSAITQGNVIDLKDPQTSFDDPALTA
ncbi:MAG: segregation protein, partial [Mucilaginibacter sp.]|nr:segregation protein [Mucilaginibacter sp.]